MANGDHKNLCGRSLRSFFGGFMSVLLASTFFFLSRTDDAFGRTLVEFRSIIIGSSQKSKFVCSAGKRYVNGTCVCPVLFSGSDDCKRPWGGIRPGCITPMRALSLKRYAESVNVSFGKEESDRLQGDLPRLSTFDTCAVVGSSSSLVNGVRAYGREIDSHTAVIRFNDAPTKGFERWVGSTTTLRIQNVIHCGFAESPHELCMRYTLNETNGEQIDKCKNEYRCRRVKGTHPMVFYAMDYWRLAPPPIEQFEPRFRKLSAGFFGIALSLHLCGQVDVYGIEGKKSHYFIKRVRGANRKSFKKRHNWAWERWCLKELEQGLLPRVFIK